MKYPNKVLTTNKAVEILSSCHIKNKEKDRILAFFKALISPSIQLFLTDLATIYSMSDYYDYYCHDI